jgi:hypothetical protein
MMQYVLNRRSRTLHKLPASESCNTDDIASEHRFYVALVDEDVVAYIGLGRVRRCLRCFRGELPQDG